MSNFRKRLADVEEQRAFRDWQEGNRLFEGRSRGELMFFSLYGYFPEGSEGELPQRQEFTAGSVRIVITSERVDE